MADGIYVALSGAVAQAAALETTAQNLANASTEGYQRLRPVFHEVLSGVDKHGVGGRFTSVSATELDTSVGELRNTGHPLDIALAKNTYLAVQTQQGERYTRAGSLHTDTEGMLRTAQGDAVVGEDGKAIKVQPVAAGPVGITPDGQVKQGEASVGRLRTVTFAKPELLSHEGKGRLAVSGAGAPTASKENVQVGVVEGSNASVVGAMTDMVSASRAFDVFQRALDAFRDADRKVVETVPGDQ